MVEVTYQMVLSTLQTVGLLVGIIYYIMTLQNSRKNQQTQLETRQTQLFMQMYQQANSEERWKTWAELLNLEVTDYEDFLMKFDHSVNPENYGKRAHLWFSYNILGNLLYEGKLEIHEVNRLAGISAILQWEKWNRIIYQIREKQDIPNYMRGFEYIIDELKKYREQTPNLYT